MIEALAFVHQRKVIHRYSAVIDCMQINFFVINIFCSLCYKALGYIDKTKSFRNGMWQLSFFHKCQMKSS